MRALGGHLPPALHTLNLLGGPDNRIGDEGVRALVSHQLPSTLHTLVLSCNDISDVGVQVLIANLSTTLCRLDLTDNNISDEAEEDLARHLPNTLHGDIFW